MLCCVSRRAVAGADQGPPYDHCSSNVRSIEFEKVEPEIDRVEDVPPILLPCAICARTFMPQSLEKHSKICERSVVKKRKPFDSSKQRIQGTELAEFLPKQEKRRHYQEDRSSKSKSSWKQTHDDFLQAIRAAKGEIIDPATRKPSSSAVSSGAPTRVNEQGMCPTCGRHFGVKAYDRHVAWCKERVTRAPNSPATNIAKERLDARMKYRAPALKNRRAITREKYSPGSAFTLNAGVKTSPTLPGNRAKESVSVPNCSKTNDSPVKQKPAIVRRPGHVKDPPAPSGPMKSRPADRINRPEDEPVAISFRPAPPTRMSQLPVPPLKPKRETREEYKSDIVSPRFHKKQCRKYEDKSQRGETVSFRSKDDGKNLGLHSARSQKNIVSARSQGNPKTNDTKINVDILGMTVHPCTIHSASEFVTWKQISQKKNMKDINIIQESINNINNREVDFPRNDRLYTSRSSISQQESENNFSVDDKDEEEGFLLKRKIDKCDKSKLCEDEESINCLVLTPKLNRTYSISDSIDNELCDSDVVASRKWKPVRHSPRIEFCLPDPEKSTCNKSPFPFGNPTVNLQKNVEEKKESPEKCENKIETLVESKNRNIIDEVNSDEKLLNSLSQEMDKDLFKSSKGKSSPENLKLLQNQSLEKKQLKLENYEETTLQNNDEILQNNITDSETVILQDELSPREELLTADELNCQISMKEDETLLYGDNSNDILLIENDDVKEINSVPSEQKTLNLSFDEPYEHSNELNTLYETQKCEKECTNVPDEVSEPKVNYDKEISRPEVQNDDDTVKFDEIEENIPQNQLLNNNEFINKESLISVNHESNSIELETDLHFIKDILKPTRSSTPLEDEKESDEISCKKSDELKNSLSANCEWKLTVETETGTEIMHRVDNINSDFSNTKNEIIERHNCPEIVKNCLESSKSEIQPTVSSRSTETEEISLQKESKEIASQINICDCTLKTSPHLNTCDILNKECLDHRERITENTLRLEDTENCKKDKNCCLNDLDNKSKVLLDPIVETDNTMDNEINEIYNNYVNKDFEYDSDNTIAESVQSSRKSVKSSIAVKNIIKSQNSDNLIKRKIPLTKRSTAPKSRRSIIAEMEKKIRRDMNILRDSTENLISSCDAIEFTNIKQAETVEVETIEEIGTRNRSVMLRILPEIKGTSVIVRENYEGKQKIESQTYWERASKISRNRLINLDPPNHVESRIPKVTPKIRVLPPVSNNSPLLKRSSKDYDPFLIAEQQMNELLSDTSDQSVTDNPSSNQNRETSFPLSHSSAFVKYPFQSSFSSPGKRSSLIAPPSEFDDLTSDFSSDSTETNSLSREVFLKDLKDNKEFKDSLSKANTEKKSPTRELGRRVIIDKSKALGGEVADDGVPSRNFIGTEKTRKLFDKVSPKVLRPTVNRSQSIRASSAPKATPERKISNNSNVNQKQKSSEPQRSSNTSLNNRNNNYSNLSGSNLSLSSIVSSEVDIKRSNSVFEELMTSFEDDNGAFPSLRSFLKSDSLSISSPVHGRQRNGQISDEELSSPESYKRQEHSKLSADSAYSSLNRKYSNHGRSTNDVGGRLDEDMPRNNRRDGDGVSSAGKCKMSKFCHECGSKFPETAKFCCECGIRRLAF